MVNNRISKLIIAVIISLLSGCSLQNKVPPTSKYLLKTSKNSAVSTAQGCQKKVLRIGIIESSALLNTRDIIYETDTGRSYSYTKARWMNSVNSQLSDLLAASITRHKSFKSVIHLKSFAKNDLLLESSIYDFSQTIHDDGSSTLKVAVKLVLLEQYRRNIVASKLIEIEKKDVGGDVDSAVAGYSAMVSELLQKSNAFLDANCL
ncbi:MAG: ABC-type transport auxiliary lipoprotein family protein [Campylobacterota bacterium]